MLRASLLILSLAGCEGARATRAECTEMLDKYLDMTIPREVDRDLRKSDPVYLKVQRQCEAEITKREYRCAMKTFTPEGWQACID